MYSLPQEIEVWYIIPAIRKEMARLLTEKHKLTYEKAGGILGVTKAAVSQYLKNKRGSFKLPTEIKKEIKKSVEIIARDNMLAVKEMQRILGLMKKSRDACNVCKKYNKGVIKICNMKPAKNYE